MIRNERGAALLLVLWATVLLAALLVGVAAASRSQSEAALYGSERVRAASGCRMVVPTCSISTVPGSRCRWWM